MSAVEKTLVIIGALVLVVFLIGGGPFAGFLIQRAQRRSNEAFYRSEGESGTTSQFFMPKTKWDDTGVSVLPAMNKAGVADYLFRPAPGVIGALKHATLTLTDETPGAGLVVRRGAASLIEQIQGYGYDGQGRKTWLLDANDDLGGTPIPEGVAAEALIAAVNIPTSEWDVVGEIVEEVSQAEQAFYADPLGSWVAPPESAEVETLPLANDTFDIMVMNNRLTGFGIDIDTEWAAWNLYKEESYA